jgi:hypothetical protein
MTNNHRANWIIKHTAVVDFGLYIFKINAYRETDFNENLFDQMKSNN